MTEKVVIGSLEFEDNSASAIQNAERNVDGLRDSVEGASVATEDLETNQLGLLSAFERIERKIDPVSRAQQAYEKDLKKVQSAIEANAVSHDRGAKAIDNLEGRLQRAKDKAEKYSASTREAAEAQARQERETLQLSRSMQSLESRINPAAAAQRKFEDECEDVREALRRQVIESDKAADMLNRLEREYKQGGRAADTFDRKTRGASGGLRLLAGAVAGLGIGLAARQVIGYADAWAAAENRLRLVTDSAGELREVQAGLFDISQDNFADFGATADLYNRLSIGTERLSISQERLLGLTDTVAKSIAISGSSAQAAQGAITQFGQALSGDFKGASQELNSIIEQTPGLARAIAQGLGVATGELKKLAKDGELSAEVVIAALEKVGPAVDKQFGTLNPTLDQIGVTAKNAASKISDAFAEPLLDEFKTDLKGLVAFLESEETLNAARRFGEGLSDALAIHRLNIEILNERSKKSDGTGSGILEWYEGQLQKTREIKEETLGRLQHENSIEGQLETSNQKLSDAVELYELIRKSREENVGGVFGFATAPLARVVERERKSAIEAQAELNKLIVEGRQELFESGKLTYVEPDIGFEELVERLKATREELDPLTEAILFTNSTLKITGETAGKTGEEIKKAFDFKPLKLEEQQLRAQIEAVGLGEDRVSQLEIEQKIQAEILRIKASGKTFEEAALRTQLETNEALQAELTLEQRRADTKRDTEDLEKLVTAARLGQTQLDLARDRLDIEEEIAELKLLAESAGVNFDESEERKSLERRNALDEQLSTIESGFRDISKDFDRDLSRVVDSFVDDLLENGADAFENLADFAWDSFKQVLVSPLKQALTGLLQGLFSGGFAGGGFQIPGTVGIGGGAFPSINTEGGLAPSAAGVAALVAQANGSIGVGQSQNVFLAAYNSVYGSNGSLARAGQDFGGFIGLGSKGQNISGELFSGAGIGFSTSQVINSFGGRGQTGSSIGGTLGGAIGSAASSIGGSLGSTLGELGSFAGPVGAIIGSLLGKAFGSLFAGPPSDFIGQTVFDPITGSVKGTGQKNNSAESNQNLEIAQAIASEVSSVSGRLADLVGAELKNLSSTSFRDDLINVAAGNRDDIRIGNQGASGQIANAQRFENSEDGAKQAIEAGIKLVANSFQGGDSVLTPVLKALVSADEPVENIVSTLEQLKTALATNDDELSEWVQRIDQINDTFEPLIEKTRALGSAAAEATRELEAANRAALERVGEDFDTSTRDAHLGITSPLQLGAENLLEEQTQRLKDAEAVSINAADAQRRVNEVMALNADQWSQFVEQAGSTPEALEKLAAAMASVSEQARAAGADTAMLEQQLDQARASFAEEFDKQSSDLLLNMVNAPLARFQAMLEQQAARINTAASLGGDVRLAQEVAGSQREEFFSSLSDEDRLQLADFLGLIEDYTGRMGIVITQTRDVFSAQRAAQAEALKASIDLAEAWQSSTQSIKDTLREAEERFGGRSVADNLGAAQTRFDELLSRLTVGDQSAATDIPAAANQLLELIQEGYGTTPEGIARTEAALEGLRRAEELSSGYTEAAQSETDRIRNDDERLDQLEKALQSPDLSLPFLEQQVSLLDTSTSQGQQVVNLLSEYLSLAAAQTAAVGLQESAVQIASEQYLGASALQTSNTDTTTLTEISPTAQIAAATRSAETTSGNRDLELAQTQLLTETAASTRATRMSIEDFLVRASNADGLNDLTLNRIEAAVRATPSAVQSLETTMRATASDQVTAMAGFTLAMQGKYDEMIDVLSQGRDYLQEIKDDMRKVRVALVDA